eukprot:Skav229118  [mRNA]  locus=scaffold92:787533:795942:+ [translate_table: standard]
MRGWGFNSPGRGGLPRPKTRPKAPAGLEESQQSQAALAEAESAPDADPQRKRVRRCVRERREDPTKDVKDEASATEIAPESGEEEVDAPGVAETNGEDAEEALGSGDKAVSVSRVAFLTCVVAPSVS